MNFFITKTKEITSCSYALKSWNTLYNAADPSNVVDGIFNLFCYYYHYILTVQCTEKHTSKIICIIMYVEFPGLEQVHLHVN